MKEKWSFQYWPKCAKEIAYSDAKICHFPKIFRRIAPKFSVCVKWILKKVLLVSSSY